MEKVDWRNPWLYILRDELPFTQLNADNTPQDYILPIESLRPVLQFQDAEHMTLAHVVGVTDELRFLESSYQAIWAMDHNGYIIKDTSSEWQPSDDDMADRAPSTFPTPNAESETFRLIS